MARIITFILLFIPLLSWGQAKFNRGAKVGKPGTTMTSIQLTGGVIVHNAGTTAGYARLQNGFVIGNYTIARIAQISGDWQWILGAGNSRTFIVPTDGIIIGNGCTITAVHVTAGLVDSLYVGGVGYAFGDFAESVEIETLVTLQADTVPLVTFGAGGGQVADVELFTDSTMCGDFWLSGSDTLVITSLKGIIQTGEGTSTIGVQVWWNDSLKQSTATKLNTDPYTINNVYIGNEDIAFLNDEIPPNCFVWCTTPTISAGNRPSYLSITLSGFKRNYSY